MVPLVVFAARVVEIGVGIIRQMVAVFKWLQTYFTQFKYSDALIPVGCWATIWRSKCQICLVDLTAISP